MVKKASLLTIHGMGETKEAYAEPLFAELANRLGGSFGNLHTSAIYYQDILQPNEDRVWGTVARKVRWDGLRKFVLFGLADATGLENGKEAWNSVYSQAQLCIAKALLKAKQETDDGSPVVILAQSLGCHVISCYLWDAAQHDGYKNGKGKKPVVGKWQDFPAFEAELTGDGRLTENELKFIQGKTLRALYTTGCNIPVFMAAHATKDIVPFPNPNPGVFEWHNFYDKDDVLGWPLADLYGDTVTDFSIDAGGGILGWIGRSWNPLSHMQYWGDDEVLDPLTKLLRPLLK